MRYSFLGLILSLVLLAAPLHAADTKKAPPADVGPGRIAWFDLATTDLAKSKEFYSKLFGWTFAPVAYTDLAAEIVSDKTPIGTLRTADGVVSPFNGVVYVQVSDIEASCAKAKELGGTIPAGFPFDLPDGIGAIGLVTDPGGAPIGMYSRTLMAKKDTKGK
ncbi:MAG: VOC family protein [Candidatus Eisenbacteria bacterium]|nr:VOC family protein [Candidatus Eisenbacteria bacterium]